MLTNSVLHAPSRQVFIATNQGFPHFTLIAVVRRGRGIEADQGGKKIFFVCMDRLTEKGGRP